MVGRVSQRLIAARANVSRMTVSLALRDHPSIPPRTCRRIQELARILGYRPDPQLTRLMEDIRTKKRRVPDTIAYLTTHRTRLEWKKDAATLEYYEGSKQRAEANGFQLEDFWLYERGMTAERLSVILRNRGIQGVILAPLPEPHACYQGFRWEYFSAVAFGYSITNLALNRACHHHFQSMLLLTQELHRLGYRRPGLVMGPQQDERVNHRWTAAFRVGQSFYAEGERVPDLVTGGWTKENFTRWREAHQPDVIITSTNEAAAVIAWLAQSGLRVPRDVGLANLHLHSGVKGMTGINQGSGALAAAAVDFLISLMRHNERGLPQSPRTVMVDGTVMIGGTTRETGPGRESASRGRSPKAGKKN